MTTSNLHPDDRFGISHWPYIINTVGAESIKKLKSYIRMEKMTFEKINHRANSSRYAKEEEH